MRRYLVASLFLALVGCGKPFVGFPGGTTGEGGTGGTGGSAATSTGSTGGSEGGSGGRGATTTSTGSGCIPKTCADYGFNCGGTDDGCGNQLFCGHCNDVEFCNVGVCDKTPCQKALEDNSTVPGLDMTEYNFFLGALNCVCHDPATSSVCGSNLESQTMCGNNGWNTGNLTQDFLDNNPIGSCCSMECAVELAECRNQL